MVGSTATTVAFLLTSSVLGNPWTLRRLAATLQSGASGDEVEAVVLFVMIFKWQPGLSKEQRDGALMRRAQWNYPEGINLIGEYWPMVDFAAAVCIFETNDHKAILELGFTWGDVFDIQMAPAVDVADGLRMGAELMGAASV